MKKLEVTAAKSVQTAVPLLDKEEKTIYYVVVGEGPDRIVINVGKKTYDGITKLLNEQEKAVNGKSKQ